MRALLALLVLLAIPAAGCRTETDKLIAAAPQGECVGTREVARLFTGLHPAAAVSLTADEGVRIDLARPAVRRDRTLLWRPKRRALTVDGRPLRLCETGPGHPAFLSLLLYDFVWQKRGRPPTGLGAEAPPFSWTCLEPGEPAQPLHPCFLDAWVRGHVAMLEAGLDERRWRKLGERQADLVAEIGRLQAGERDDRRLTMLTVDWHTRLRERVFSYIPKNMLFNAVAFCGHEKADLSELRTFEVCALLDLLDREGAAYGAGQTRMVLQWLFTDGVWILKEGFAKFGEDLAAPASDEGEG